jgi:hypothetical protein
VRDAETIEVAPKCYLSRNRPADLGDVLQGGGLHARDRHEVTRKKKSGDALDRINGNQLFQRHELHVFRVRVHVVYVVDMGIEAVAAWPSVPPGHRPGG